MPCIDSVTCRAFPNTLLAKFHFIWATWPKREQKYAVKSSNCPVFVKELIVQWDRFKIEFFITEVFQRLSYQSGLFEIWLMDQKFFPPPELVFYPTLDMNQKDHTYADTTPMNDFTLSNMLQHHDYYSTNDGVGRG